MIICDDCKCKFIESSKKLYERIRSNYKIKPLCRDCSRLMNAEINQKKSLERKNRKIIREAKSIPYLQRKYKLDYKAAKEVMENVKYRLTKLS